MSSNLGTSNSSRYWSVPDHADFSLPNGDWLRAAIVQVQASANPRYIFSTNGFGVANSLNLIISSGSNMVGVRVNTGVLLETGVAPPNGTWILIYTTRRSGNLYCGWAQIGGSSVTESAAQALSAGSDGSVMYIGARSDLDANRFWLGGIAAAFFSNTHGITTEDVLAICKGAPALAVLGNRLNFGAHLYSATPAAINDFVGGKTVTKNGTGYGADIDELITIFPQRVLKVISQTGNDPMSGSASGIASASGNLDTGITLAGDATAQATATGDINSAAALQGDAAGQATASGDLSTGIPLAGNAAGQGSATGDLTTAVKGVRVTLHDAAGNPLASQSNIQVCWWDEQEPQDFTSIIYQTGTATTNGSGVLEINVNGLTSLAVGSSGFMLAYKLDGVDHQDSLVFAGRLPVVDIS